jgi:hypothetical protein
MTHHDHGKQHHGQQHHPRPASKNKAIHKDWRVWTVIALMLGAMLMYVLSDDESLQPDGEAGPAMPAEAAP